MNSGGPQIVKGFQLRHQTSTPQRYDAEKYVTLSTSQSQLFPLKHAGFHWKHIKKKGKNDVSFFISPCLLPGRSRSRIFLAKIRDGTRGLLPHRKPEHETVTVALTYRTNPMA